MKKSFLVLVILSFSLISLFANGLSLNSIGPKALGMGGAYIGLADDPTAIYWNPAGLAGQETGMMLFGSDIVPFATYNYDAFNVSAETKTNHYISPNFFFNYNLGDLALGFGAYVPAGLGAEWDGDDLTAFGGPPQIDLMGDGSIIVDNPFAGKSYDWMSKIGVFNFSPAVAYKVSDILSVGANLNIYYGMMELKRAEDMVNILAAFGAPADGMVDTQTAFDITGLGYGGSLGLMFTLSEKLNVGLSYRSPVNVEFEGTADIHMELDMDGDGIAETSLMDRDARLDIEWPTWIGFGGAYKACEKLNLTFDFQYTGWGALHELVAEIDDMPDMVNGGMATQEMPMHLHWADAVQLRFGAEYMMNDNFAFRCGYYNDPAPAPDATVNILFPSSENHVLTGGLGFVKGSIKADFGIEYLMGYERDIAPDPAGTNMPGVHQMDIMAFSFGLGYLF
jgi:long-chain fatty acid transport protein